MSFLCWSCEQQDTADVTLQGDDQIPREVMEGVVADGRKDMAKTPETAERWKANSDRDLDWINHALKNMWPQFEQAVRTVIDNKIMPKVREKALKNDKIKDIKFAKYRLGGEPPKVLQIHTTHLDQGRCKVRAHVIYESDMHVELQIDAAIIGSVHVGIKDTKIDGEMIFILSPYEEDSPDVGSLSLYFVEVPKIDFDFAGHADFLTKLGIDDLVIKTMTQELQKKLVLPNILTVNIGLKDFKVFPPVFEKPTPIGLLQLRLTKGAKLSEAAKTSLESNMTNHKKPGFLTRAKRTFEGLFEYVDNKLGESMGKDMKEYLEFRVGETIWNPKLEGHFGETFEFPVHEVEQQLHIQVWDRDLIGEDDVMGQAAPIDLVNVHELAGKDVPLLSPEDGIPWAVVSFQVDFKAVKTKAEGKSECMVVIGIRDLAQAKGNLQGKKLAVRAEIGETQMTTPPGSVLKGAQDLDRFKELMADIRQNMKDEHLDEATIDRVLAVASPPRVSINQTLHLACPTSALSSQYLKFSLIEMETTQKKEIIHHVIGKSKKNLKLADLRSAKEHRMSELVEFESSLGDFTAQLVITLCALDSAKVQECM
eukprot:TRINITY_DN68082_c0_g1_i1.p1 TRINITY_DN68082_c0_g1~~TRINITY_DN68082_c0_g1_i1.p1  ORF type:complete len:594 (-),score=121.89 TRINITY_DN68082_c0_g1_i1:42-1823(-)